VTLNDQYTDNAHRAETAAAKVTDAWAEGIKKASEQFRTPTLPYLPTDPTVFVQQWFDFTDRLAKVNREYVVHLSSVVNELNGAVRQHMEGLSEAVRDQVQSVSNTAKDQLAKVADAQREQVEQAERIEREQIREVRAAERQKARQERQAAQERYQDLNKSELSEELARRELPKTGTIDELVERLVDADTK
jgi:hypothetical protein